MNVREMQAARDRMRAQRVDKRSGRVNVTVVIGPPCSGKTTFVHDNAADGDIIIDFDAIAVALGSNQTHDHSPSHLAVAHAARQAAIARAVYDVVDGTVWIILTDRCQLAEFGLSGSRTHSMDTPLIECERRAKAQNRTAAVIDIIRGYVR